MTSTCHRCFPNIRRSSFSVQVGDPPTELRLLPSTSLAQTLVVGPGGCPPNFNNYTFQSGLSGNEANPKGCSTSRGELFDRRKDQSAATVAGMGNPKVYNLIDYQTVGNYGYNFSAYGYRSNIWPQRSSNKGIQAPIAEFNDINYTWLGLLSIDVRPANYTGEDNVTVQIPSLLESLASSGNIPSRSWGYHAGSYGR